MDLHEQVKNIENTNLSNIVVSRLNEFSSYENKNYEDWFSELCFCILTANSKASTAINIQNELGFYGFSNLDVDSISNVIRKNKHRFSNNKAKYISEARKFIDIKSVIDDMKKLGKDNVEIRNWIAENVKGIGYKEASHFLRNTGHFDLAILDRHILNLMVENKIIQEKPKTLTKNIYLKLELIFKKMAESLNMSCAELDLYMWYMKAGTILK
jgi:N-glycosylase/DNA lyase